MRGAYVYFGRVLVVFIGCGVLCVLTGFLLRNRYPRFRWVLIALVVAVFYVFGGQYIDAWDEGMEPRGGWPD